MQAAVEGKRVEARARIARAIGVGASGSAVVGHGHAGPAVEGHGRGAEGGVAVPLKAGRGAARVRDVAVDLVAVAGVIQPDVVGSDAVVAQVEEEGVLALAVLVPDPGDELAPVVLVGLAQALGPGHDADAAMAMDIQGGAGRPPPRSAGSCAAPRRPWISRAGQDARGARSHCPESTNAA